MARSKGYEEQLEKAKDIVINSIGETMDLYGVNRSVGNLYGTMVFEQKSMTLDEMRYELQMSKPSMSAGVKRLQEFDGVKQEFIRGSRKQHFTAEKDFFTFFGNFFSQKWKREIKLNLEAIHKAEAILNPIIHSETAPTEVKEEAYEVLEQIEHSKVYYDWLSTLSKALASGKIFDYFPIPDNNQD
ncbi:GbsR/MarR family transcriptional regulator [Staphylococcus gallinarum]|uniref:choline uptake/conversion transcriptional regulator CudC n=1 Tax=Staphylococcus gallinarum TaxID=1293 RepID=UPI000D1C62EF|nr:GbsR/MarR family transcriptional regulator [Staphylococcus gallinarum]MBU7217029.1 GbsR/MarR family transcriptional regulator [Staphylococcus gallinarum]MCD8784968.1 GbsR/MarR family transcriptional regulator [Staphylococcus gallinarum]MCD8792759.1 GbsR/MarR family transcriptional regulator [Staphylococcus gallinarum]MCD8829873.1 GbsR/MarR family transcriptional regulator [Staphylococcus gallinarum]MCD8844817.1 GbsR/MarR family transcriptional regulator [Staphylococcus gallinarum]